MYYNVYKSISLLTFEYISAGHLNQVLKGRPKIYLFSHLADAFIQSDLQMRTL